MNLFKIYFPNFIVYLPEADFWLQLLSNLIDEDLYGCCCDTPFTRSSKHLANTFKIHVHDVCCNCSTFARCLLDVFLVIV